MVICLLQEVSTLNDLISQNSLFDSQSLNKTLHKDTGENSFTSKEGDFHFIVPDGYKVTGSEGEYLVIHQDAEQYSMIPEMSIHKYEISREEYLTGIKKIHNNVVVEKFITGKDTIGWKIVYTYKYPGMEIEAYATVYIFEKDGQVIELSTWENLQWDYFDSVAESFTLIK